MTPRRVGNYLLCDEIGAGGMARVFIGRARGDFGFSRTVAIKTLHDSYAADPHFVDIFVDEARLASRIHHPNVVSIVDVIAESGSVFLVLDYVHGVTLANLMTRSSRGGAPIPVPVAAAAVRDLLRGLHAAHEAAAEDGTPLGIVHRDVSPQNVIVGADGNARLFDFGVAKAVGRLQTTRDGSVKGKLAYMAPEQLNREPIDRRVDVFAAAVILWELLAGRELFAADSEAQVLAGILCGAIEAPSTIRADVPAELDMVVLTGLERQRDRRYATAAEMLAALDRAVACADSEAVSRVVKSLGAERLAQCAALVARAERHLPPDVPGVAVSAQSPTPTRGGPRRWLEATFVAVVAIAALALGSRSVRGPASTPSSEPNASVTPPPQTTSSGEVTSPATLVQAEPVPIVSAATSPSPRARTPPPLRRASPPTTRPTATSRPCTPIVVDDAGIHRYNRDCMR